MNPAYRYSATVLRVLDGDTVEVSLDLGFNLRQRMILRMAGINTMEKNDPDEKKRKRALEARDYVERELGSKDVICETVKPRDKYGRYLSRIHVDGRCLNDSLLELKLAERMEY